MADWLALGPSHGEFERAVGQMQCGRAAGEDGFMAEYLKYGGPEVQEVVFQVVKRTWEAAQESDEGLEAENWPSAWRQVSRRIAEEVARTNCDEVVLIRFFDIQKAYPRVPGLEWEYKVDGRLTKRHIVRAQAGTETATVVLGDFGYADDTGIVGTAEEVPRSERLFGEVLRDWEETLHPDKTEGLRISGSGRQATDVRFLGEGSEVKHVGGWVAENGRPWEETKRRRAVVAQKIAVTAKSWNFGGSSERRRQCNAEADAIWLVEGQEHQVQYVERAKSLVGAWRPGDRLPDNAPEREVAEEDRVQEPNADIGDEGSGEEELVDRAGQVPVQAPGAMVTPGVRHLYTDGSGGPDNRAGWAVVVFDAPPNRPAEADYTLFGPVVLDEWDPVFLGAEVGTNNTGELTAIGEACVWLWENREERTQDGQVVPAVIHYDSEYARDLAVRAAAPRSNQRLAESVASWVEKVRSVRPLEFRHVKGHSGDVGNDAADKFANRGLAERRAAKASAPPPPPPVPAMREEEAAEGQLGIYGGVAGPNWRTVRVAA
ncbi:rnhA, partial [Symbiodinium pilosum]